MNNYSPALAHTGIDEQGLLALEALGEPEHMFRIGAFHDRDDAFYLDRYKSAKLWAIKGMKHANDRKADVELTVNSQLPIPDASFFLFETSKVPEGIIHLARHDGILITCDSVKNWTSPDQFFSQETADLYQKLGFFSTASISSVWRQASAVQAADFEKLKVPAFRHLLSAHGEPLLNDADEKLFKTIKMEFGV